MLVVVAAAAAGALAPEEGRYARVSLAAAVGARRIPGLGSLVMSVVAARPTCRARDDGLAVPIVEETHGCTKGCRAGGVRKYIKIYG